MTAAERFATYLEGDQVDWWGLIRDPDFLDDPFDTFADLRARAPIQLDPASGCYFVLGHRAFSAVMRHPSIGRDTRHWKGAWFTDPTYPERDPVGYELFSLFQPQMINMDRDDHARMRGVYEPAFRAQAVKRLGEIVEEEIARLLDAMPAESGEVDLIQDYAKPLPLNVLCRLFDVPEAMTDRIGAWSGALIQIGDLMMTEEQKRTGLEAMKEFKAFVRDTLAVRREREETSLLRLAIEAERDGTLSEEETLTNLVAMLIAGHETTVTLVGNGLMLLLQNPDQLALLREDPELARGLVEETLRYESGGNFIIRVAREDCTVEGVEIPAGAAIIGLVRATNRDPERFVDPDRFDITRTGHAGHHTFGGGPHVCLGAPLARMEGRLAFQRLLERYGGTELAAEPVWRDYGTNARSLERLMVRLAL